MIKLKHAKIKDMKREEKSNSDRIRIKSENDIDIAKLERVTLT